MKLSVPLLMAMASLLPGCSPAPASRADVVELAVPVGMGALPLPAILASGQHNCAVFGGAGPSACDVYPTWRFGLWKPPAGITSLHVLVVGGGGGGGGSIEQGIGGNGGGSGEVVVRNISWDGNPLFIGVGVGGRGGPGFRAPGRNGGISVAARLVAHGGQGGVPLGWGGAPPSSGGGGAGGGFYEEGQHGGRGGDGGRNGSDGESGAPGTDASSTVHGTSGGAGSRFPALNFAAVSILPGAGGFGGAPGSNMTGYGGGGGGGGGGILIDHTGGEALGGAGGRSSNEAQGGAGGSGFGAGGGGAGNYVIGAHGGDGAAGVVYVEWTNTIVLLKTKSPDAG